MRDKLEIMFIVVIMATIFISLGNLIIALEKQLQEQKYEIIPYTDDIDRLHG